MNKIILTLALLFFSQSVLAEIRPEFTGSWYNPNQSGHGLSIEVLSAERSLAYWYTYDPFGNPIFLYSEGTNIGNRIQAKVYLLQGMVFGEFNPTTNNLYDWGTLTITFHSCSSATLDYQSTLEYPSGESFGSGQIPLVRLASIEGYKCSDFSPAGIYSGFAYSYRDRVTYYGYGTMDQQGELYFVSEDGVVVNGRMSADSGTAGRFTASGRSMYFVQGQPIQSGGFTASGNFSPDMVVAEYSIPATSESGLLEVHKLVHHTGRSITQSDLAGRWQAYNYITRLSESVTIGSDGSFSVTDSYGCSYNGQIGIPNLDINILQVSATVSGCSASGNYTGSGAYLENENVYFGGIDVILLIGFDDEGDAAVMRLTRY